MTEKQHSNHIRLKEIRLIEKRIKNLEAQLYLLTQTEYSPKTSKLKTVMVQNSLNQQDLSDYIVKFDTLVSEIIKEKERLYRTRQIVLDAINKLDNDQAIIVEQIYVLCWPMWKVCQQNNYSKRSIYLIRNKALDAISIPEIVKE